MTTIDLILGTGWGILIGLFYFLGLRWTVSRIAYCGNPPLFILGSFLVRTMIAAMILFLAANHNILIYLGEIMGFALARFFAIRFWGWGSLPARPFEKRFEK